MSPLCMAANTGPDTIVRELVAAGANVNDADNVSVLPAWTGQPQCQWITEIPTCTCAGRMDAAHVRSVDRSHKRGEHDTGSRQVDTELPNKECKLLSVCYACKAARCVAAAVLTLLHCFAM